MEAAAFKFTANVVREIVESHLRVHYGDKCPDYEPNCECCYRWRLLDQLLAEDRNSPDTLEQEVAELEDALEWRRGILKAQESIAGPS